MKTWFRFGVGLATLASMMLAVPQLSHAGQPVANQSSELVVKDVSLEDGGVLQGQILTSTGQARANVPVILGQKGKELVQGQTDAQGRFAFKGLNTGVYHVSAGSVGGVYRVWSDKTAPPSAKEGVMLVNNEQVVRGQIGSWFGGLSPLGQAAVIAGVAGAIAIPVAIAQNKS